MVEPVLPRASAASSTKPTRLMPYSGCRSSLRATRWPTSPAPTMIVFCRYVMLRAAPVARDRAGDGDERDRERPERHRLRQARRGSSEQPVSEEQEPDADRDQMEDAAELVRGRMVRALLVLLVQAVEPCDQDPAGNGGEEHCVLDACSEVLVRTRAGPERDLHDRERRGERDHVCEEEHAAHEPAATARLARDPALLEDLERALVREDGPLCGSDRRQRIRALEAHLGHVVPTTSRTSVVPFPLYGTYWSVGVRHRFFKARIEYPTGVGVAGRSAGDPGAGPRSQAANRPSRSGR